MSSPRTTFKDRLHHLREACLPFVARTFRGNRLRRYAAISVLLGALSVLLGVWLAFGRGDFERDIRQAVDLERDAWSRDRVEFRITAYDVYHYESLVSERERLETTGMISEFSQLGSAREQAYSTLYTALSMQAPKQHAELYAQASALVERMPPPGITDPQWHFQQDMRDYQFDWYAPQERERLAAIIDQELTPAVELYTSPLSLADGVRLTGAVAGGFVVFLMLIVAPLSAGATLAQEVHENTLQPVLGTRLRPVDIVTGLSASGISLGALLAAPSLAVMLVAGLLVGHQAHLPLLLLLLPAATIFTVLLTELVGFGLGRRWSSGIVATVLTGVLCLGMLLSIGLGMNLEDETIGFLAVMPPVGLVHGLRELFVPGMRLAPVEVLEATQLSCLAVLGFSTLAFVIARALTRRIAGRTQASLTRFEGLLAAMVTLALALAVVPDFDEGSAVPAYFVTLGMAAFPWMLILAGRVPLGDGPARLRTIPLRPIMTELLVYVALQTAVLVAIFGIERVPFEPVAALHLTWALAVLGLVAVRMVALPTNILGSLFILLCLGAVCFEFVSAGVFATAADAGRFSSAPHPFVLFEASAVLGVLQLALTVAIPVVLVRALRRGSAGLR